MLSGWLLMFIRYAVAPLAPTTASPQLVGGPAAPAQGSSPAIFGSPQDQLESQELFGNSGHRFPGFAPAFYPQTDREVLRLSAGEGHSSLQLRLPADGRVAQSEYKATLTLVCGRVLTPASSIHVAPYHPSSASNQERRSVPVHAFPSGIAQLECALPPMIPMVDAWIRLVGPSCAGAMATRAGGDGWCRGHNSR